MNSPDHRQQQECEEEECHEYQRKLLNEIGMITHGIEVGGKAWKERMSNLTKEKQNGKSQ